MTDSSFPLLGESSVSISISGSVSGASMASSARTENPRSLGTTVLGSSAFWATEYLRLLPTVA